MSDAGRRAAVVMGLCEVYGRPPMSEIGAEMYLAALADVPVGDLERAATECMHESRFFPTPAELRARTGRAAVPVEDKALRAWCEAWDAACNVGAYESVCFTDPVTTRVISTMGGWPRFCRPEQDEQWHRKEFLDTYAALVGEVVYDPHAETLRGLHEMNGRKKPAVLIGADKAKAIPDATEQTPRQVMGELKRRLKTAEDGGDLWPDARPAVLGGEDRRR